MAIAGNISIGQRRAFGLTMNIAMNARSEMMPPVNAHFQAKTNPRRPMPKSVNCKIVLKFIGSEVPLLALSIDSPISMIKANATIMALKTRAIIRRVFIGWLFLISILVVCDSSQIICTVWGLMKWRFRSAMIFISIRLINKKLFVQPLCPPIHLIPF
jgi:hypothetical protein